jgi:hypothetical protein
MPRKKTLLVNFILDSSGSMGAIKDSVISGFNEYIGTLKKSKDSVKFSLTQFNSGGVDIVYTDKPIADVKELTDETYHPDNMTPLYDAVCKTVNEVKKTAGKKRVIVVIMTDGYENASQEYDEKSLAKMVTKLQDTGRWTFVFLGANQDSWGVAMKLGIAAGNTRNWDPTDAGTEMVFSSVGCATYTFARSTKDNTSSLFADASD